MEAPKNLWLTVNRQCNIRCEWCYASDTKYTKDDEMTLAYAKEVIHASSVNVFDNIIILGGEPTLWKPLPDLIKWINKMYGEHTVITVVTNGIKFADYAYRNTLDGCIYRVGMSMKSANATQQRLLTKTNTFADTMTAIRALSNREQLHGVSITINSKVIDNLVEMAESARDNGADSLSFEMCSPSFDKDGGHNDAYTVHPKELARAIVESYDRINDIFSGDIGYQLSVPFCLFEQSFIDMLKQRNQIISGCHVMQRDGVIFTPDGNVLMCNCLHHIPIGKLGVDFTNKETFHEFWNNPQVIVYNKQLLRYPSVKCIGCSNYNECCGGCPLQWFAFQPDEVIKGERK